jgi:hypothetical protein
MMKLRERMDKWDYIKLKSLCTTKEMVSKLNRPPTLWVKAVLRCFGGCFVRATMLILYFFYLILTATLKAG